MYTVHLPLLPPTPIYAAATHPCLQHLQITSLQFHTLQPPWTAYFPLPHMPYHDELIFHNVLHSAIDYPQMLCLVITSDFHLLNPNVLYQSNLIYQDTSPQGLFYLPAFSPYPSYYIQSPHILPPPSPLFSQIPGIMLTSPSPHLINTTNILDDWVDTK